MSTNAAADLKPPLVASLKATFAAARHTASFGKSPTPEHGLPGKEWCPYCGKWWRKWAGSRLDGHSACIVPEIFKSWLKDIFAANPALTYQQVSEIIGVSPSVIRSWVAPIRR